MGLHRTGPGDPLALRALRVLHCPTATGGNPQGLADAERRVGLDSQSVCFVESPFGHRSDEILAPEGTNPIRAELSRWRLLIRALRDYDVIHFNFGRTIHPSLESLYRVRRSVPGPAAGLYKIYARLLEYRDLPLLRWAGKVIAVTFQGSDVRQADYCARHFEIHAVGDAKGDDSDPGADKRRRRVVGLFDRYADLIYGLNPDLLHLLPSRARFLPYGSVDPSRWDQIGVDPDSTRPPIVVHAPTHRGIKGTSHIVEAAQRLQREGVRFELVLVEGRSREEALRIFRSADLLVDQLLIGWYGGTAVEFMAMGKPVVCYLRRSDFGFLPEGMGSDLPLIEASPRDLYDVLKRWLTAPRYRLAQRGIESRQFVERWHDPLRIARSLQGDYLRVHASKGRST